MFEENNTIRDLQGKIIIYLRKSREEMFDGVGSSVERTLERHEEILQTWALQTLGYKIPNEYIYREVGSGETIKDRPVMTHVLSLFKKDDIGGVLVVEPQRLSRGDLIDCGTLIEILEITDTLVLTPQKIYNLKNKFDKKMFRDELLRGNEYLEYTKEILARGRKLSAMQGKYIGSAPPYGFSIEKLKDTKGNKLVPNEDSEVIKLIYKLFLEGMGTYKIANHLTELGIDPPQSGIEWEHAFVRKILRNPVYYGKITYGRRSVKKVYIDGEIKKVRPTDNNCELYEGLHDGLVSEEDFMKVQEIMNNAIPDKTPKEKVARNPLAGLVYCGICGKAVTRINNPHKELAPKLKYKVNTTELVELMNKQKKNLNLSNRIIAKDLDIARSTACDWFNPKRIRITKNFSDHWLELKALLKIKTNKFDKSILTYEAQLKDDSMNCHAHHCSNVSSKVYLVENRLLDLIKVRLENYNYMLDNYEVEYTKEIKANKSIADKIDKDIVKVKNQLKTAQELVETKVYSVQEYVERKKELTIELDKLLEKRSKVEDTKKEETLIHIKKAIPILENCLKEYPTLDVKGKNKLLSQIVDKAFYVKTIKCRHKPEQRTQFKLDVHFKI